VLDSSARDRWCPLTSREEVRRAQFTKAASTADVAPGEAKCVEVAGKKIALFKLDGSFYAIDDTCTHRNVSPHEMQRRFSDYSKEQGTS
jgi:nitrite reductase/ring-hydroxylating ferredoxin subunit